MKRQIQPVAAPELSEEVPLALPEVTESDVQAVTEVLRSTRLSRGPAEAAFERAIAKYVGVEHAVAVNSGTSGLHLSVRALGLRPGDEVITTPFSFVAAANALLYEDVRPLFVDVDPVTLNLDPSTVAVAIGDRTRAILPVHVYGHPCAMPALRELADARGLALLEDACEALGSEIGGRRAGGWGDTGVLSFYPNKQITTGEGGVVVTDNEVVAERVRLLRNQGRSPTADGFDQVDLGFSYRMSEMSCALGCSQLERIEAVVRRRQELARAYHERLVDCSELVLPALDVAGGRISWFVYAVRLAAHYSAADRDRLIGRLRCRGVECGRYFLPIHLQPLYRERFGYQGGEYPVAEAAGARSIALPFSNQLRADQIDRVCTTLLTELGC